MTRYVNILKQADIFYQLTPTQLELIGNLCSERSYNSGEIIFPEGADSDELYVIIQGEVDILVNPALVSNQPGEMRTPVTIATMRRGQSFGEIALVDQGLRSATAKATQNGTNLLVLPREKLMNLCDTYPQLGYHLMRNLAADLALKVRSTDLRIREELLYGTRHRS
ncbi:MAG: cyclic nucleotide-binding domain-containing protein [Chloroflexota bacterium]|nr:MAG: cyclic nucleotide-binding domain-containing protein [Chloroflexota bacterium]